jgi:hypothetical protein
MGLKERMKFFITNRTMTTAMNISVQKFIETKVAAMKLQGFNH